MSRHRRLLGALLFSLLLGGVAGVAGVWFFFFSNSAPVEADVDQAASG